MAVSDHISFARILYKAGHTPEQVRARVAERFGDVAAAVVIAPEFVTEAIGEVGEVASETVGELVDDALDCVGDVVDDFFDW